MYIPPSPPPSKTRFSLLKPSKTYLKGVLEVVLEVLEVHMAALCSGMSQCPEPPSEYTPASIKVDPLAI